MNPKETYKISIIVPVYNLEAYIERTVRSILEQTYTNTEIILVDDGSQDKSLDILEQLAQKDGRIRIIHQENAGVTKARIAGILASTGDWIGFVDGDDYVEPEMYERLLENALEYHADISHCGYQMVFPSRVDYYYNTGETIVQDRNAGMRDLMEGKFIEPGLWNKLYKREIVLAFVQKNVMDFTIKNLEDLLMNYYLFQLAECSVYQDSCPYHYMVRKGSATTSEVNEHMLRDPLRVLKQILRDTNDEELKIVVKRRILARYVQIATMPLPSKSALLKYKREARKNLKKVLPEVLHGDFSRKQKIQCVWSRTWPWSYSVVHKMYGVLSGSSKKYDVD